MVNSIEETAAVGTFFDNHIDIYGNLDCTNKYGSRDTFFVEFITKNTRKSILDIGCSTGSFISCLNYFGLDMEITALDPSKNALDRINFQNVIKIQGHLPYRVPANSKYSYIHIQDVLHHVTGNSVNESKKMVVDSLKTLRNILTDDGFILLGDLFYESYIFPTFTRSTIKTMLNFQNKFGMKVPFKEFIDGLDVCFYTRDEFRSMIQECNLEIVDYREWYWDNKKYKKQTLLIKRWGYMCFIIKKRA